MLFKSGVTNFSLGAKFGPLPVFKDKVLLEYNCSFAYKLLIVTSKLQQQGSVVAAKTIVIGCKAENNNSWAPYRKSFLTHGLNH